MGLEFCELQTLSNFSFLKGASHPEEIVNYASILGYKGIAVTDHNSFSGVVRGYFAAKDLGINYVVGTRLTLQTAIGNNVEVLSYPNSRNGYGKLCALLSKGNLRVAKGNCFLTIDDLAELPNDISYMLVPPRTIEGPSSEFERLKDDFNIFLGDFCDLVSKANLFIAYTNFYSNQDLERRELIIELSKHFNLSLIVSNDALFHSPQRRALQDILTCVRLGTTIKEAGFSLHHNAERFLKPLKELARLYREIPQGLRNSLILSEQCKFSLDELKYEYPNEICPAGVSAHDYLRELTFNGAKKRYPDGIPEKIIRLLEDEFTLIRELQYEHYFLTCYDIVRYAQEIGVLCQGRGAAANSAVCFCLGITSVDPSKIDLLFARFVSKARNEPPDIDIDFEHERREDVIQYIYSKYGRHRAGLVCNVITYRHRSAVREVGKSLGLSLDTVGKVASLIHRWDKCQVPDADLIAAGLNPKDRILQTCFKLTHELIGFPRHLSQHSGGFVITEKLLSETVPILNSAMESRTIIEWNKDDIELLGMLKIDILALGMLTCIRKALDLINERYKPERPYTLYSLPHDDPAVYDMICKADTVGVFQIESRAQMTMLPRLKPRCFYDLVIEVAIVRPGPIHGNMVHPYLKRRNGLEPAVYPDERIKEILGKTLGVPLFQEQAMKLVMVVANFSAEKADKLRRAIAAWRRNKDAIAAFEDEIMIGMLKNNYTKEFAQSCIDQMKGFSEYGFPESHAASFAHLVYASSWIKKHYPTEFGAAILNSQPMGFYSPSQLVRDALDHDVKVLPIDVTRSEWDCTVEGDNELRLGFRQIKGMHELQAKLLTGTREIFPEFTTIKELYGYAHALKFGLRRDTLMALARSDAFLSLGISVREALWIIKGLPLHAGPLDPDLIDAKAPALKKMSLQQEMFLDYSTTGLSLKAHPMGLVRNKLEERKVVTSSHLKSVRAKTHLKTAGLITCRQRPGTAKGTVFLTLEDETGSSNLIIRSFVYENYRPIVTGSSAVIAKGHIERTAEVVHLIVSELEPIDDWLRELKSSKLPSKTYSY